MALYEHVFLARQDLSTQQVEELTAQYKAIIEQMGGKIAKSEYWGVKSLTYRMRKNRKAHFTLMNVDAPSAAMVEVERQQRINEDVLRNLTIRVEEHETEPSAMMRKVDRDRDRDDRRGGFDRGGAFDFGQGPRVALETQPQHRDGRDGNDRNRVERSRDGQAAAPQERGAGEKHCTSKSGQAAEHQANGPLISAPASLRLR